MDELIEIYKRTLKELHGNSKTDAEIDKLARDIIESVPDKEVMKRSIGFDYYKGMISEREVEDFKLQVEKTDFIFFKRDKSNEAYNSFEDFASKIILFLGSDVTGTLLVGAAGSGLWSIVTDWIRSVRKNIKGKKLKKISGGEIKGEIKVVLHLTLKIDEINEIDFKLGDEIPTIDLEDSLKKALAVTKSETEKDKIELGKTKKRYKYNYQSKEWEIVRYRKNLNQLGTK